MQKFTCSFDWLNGVVRCTDIEMFFKSLENISPTLSFSNFKPLFWAPRGIRNYNVRYGFQGSTNFVVAYNCNRYDEFTALSSDTRNPYIFISISSQGINLLSRDEFYHLCRYFSRCGFKASRADVALDIFDKSLADDVSKEIYQGFRYGIKTVEGKPTVCSAMSLKPKYVRNGGKRHRVDRVQIREFQDTNNPEETRYNVTFGFHDSSFGMFRMYDKYLEQGFDAVPSSDPLRSLIDNVYPEMTWLRLEYELHNEHANNLFHMYADNNYNELDCWTSSARKMFNIKIAKSEGYDTRFMTVSPCWDDFLSSVSENIDFVQLGKGASLFQDEEKSDLQRVVENILRNSNVINFFLDIKDRDPRLAFYVCCELSARAQSNPVYIGAYKSIEDFDFSSNSLLSCVCNSPHYSNAVIA